MLAPPDALQQGQVLGEYEVIEAAGSGGMGIVYRARQRSLRRVVALKVIRADIAVVPEYRERFLREARLAASVDHPHVVPVYDVGEADSCLFLAMQWVEGRDLKQAVETAGRLAPDRAVPIATQIAGALDAVHSAGLIHRDVKPANVLLRDVGSAEHAYLTDFGVARPSHAADQLTRTGWMVGTSGYLSPEQIRGQDPGPRSDLYALGCLFFEMLTGRPPFTAENDMALRWAHANDPRPLASRAAPQLGSRYDEFVATALAIDPAQRFASGREFAQALTAAQSGSSTAGAMAVPIAVPHTPTAVGPPTPIPAPVQMPAPVTPYPAYAYATPTPQYPHKSRSGSPLALILLAVIALAGCAAGALAAAGVFSHQTSDRAVAPPRGQNPSSKQPSTPNGSGTASNLASNTFNGQAFSISYPLSWQVKDAEQNKGTYTDTTFVSPNDSNTLVRVDYSPNPPSDPMTAAQPVINGLQGQPGYKRLALRRGTFDGFPAVRWKFRVLESGVLLQKEDLFIVGGTGSIGFGVLTQAPASTYAGLAPTFAKLRRSLVVK